MEFTNRNTSNAEYLNILYSAFFDRAPDATGFNAWLVALNSGTSRQEVLNGFLGSQEFANLAQQYGIQAT